MPTSAPGSGSRAATGWPRQRAAILEESGPAQNSRTWQLRDRMDFLLGRAAHGPVVMVNVSEYRCDALIVSDGRVNPVRLPGLTRNRPPRIRCRTSWTAADEVNGRVIDDVLRWTWNVIVEPVLPTSGSPTGHTGLGGPCLVVRNGPDRLPAPACRRRLP